MALLSARRASRGNDRNQHMGHESMMAKALLVRWRREAQAIAEGRLRKREMQQ